MGLFILEHPVRAAEVLACSGCRFWWEACPPSSPSGALSSWQWVMSLGLLIIAHAFILNGWPESSLWVIGLFVGIDLPSTAGPGWCWR